VSAWSPPRGPLLAVPPGDSVRVRSRPPAHPPVTCHRLPVARAVCVGFHLGCTSGQRPHAPSPLGPHRLHRAWFLGPETKKRVRPREMRTVFRGPVGPLFSTVLLDRGPRSLDSHLHPSITAPCSGNPWTLQTAVFPWSLPCVCYFVIPTWETPDPWERDWLCPGLVFVTLSSLPQGGP
jgi:hypothetical protein